MNALTVSFKADKKQILDMEQTFKLINLSAQKRQRLVWRLAKYGMIASVSRQIKKQEKITGGAYPKRNTNDKKDKIKPMLSKIATRIVIRQNPADNSVVLYFKGNYQASKNKTIKAGVIANVHQNGKNIEMNKNMYKKDDEKQKSAPTKKMIKTLRLLGYKIPNTNKKASKQWIEEHLTYGRAGGIIRMMTNHKGQKRKWGEWNTGAESWAIKIPARPFFDFTDEEYEKSLIRELKAIDFGFDVKKQDMEKRR